MSKTIKVTWAQEAIDGALDRAVDALKRDDSAHPGVARLSITDLACLIDLGRHALRENEQTQRDLFVLAQVGRMYLDALNDDPDNEYLTLPEAMLVTEVREAVERRENL